MVQDDYEHHVEEDCEDDDSAGDGEHTQECDACFTPHIQEASPPQAHSIQEGPAACLCAAASSKRADKAGMQVALVLALVGIHVLVKLWVVARAALLISERVVREQE